MIVAVLAFVASVALLVVSAFVDGTGPQAWLLAGSAALGVVLGATIPFIRAVYVDSFSRPTRPTILERRNGDGGDVTIRLVEDPRQPVAHGH
jgi:MFS family permease